MPSDVHTSISVEKKRVRYLGTEDFLASSSEINRQACSSGGQSCELSKGTLFENLLCEIEATARGCRRPGLEQGPMGTEKRGKNVFENSVLTVQEPVTLSSSMGMELNPLCFPSQLDKINIDKINID
ncbi:hypothetical protein ACRRTK_003872 [Alexandromys fortis]